MTSAQHYRPEIDGLSRCGYCCAMSVRSLKGSVLRSMIRNIFVVFALLLASCRGEDSPYSGKPFVTDREIVSVLDTDAHKKAARRPPIPEPWKTEPPPVPDYVSLPDDAIGAATGKTYPFNTASFVHWSADRQRVLQLVVVIKDAKNETAVGVRYGETVWYRISLDGGKTFTGLRQIVQVGRSPESPFSGVVTGRNSIGFCGTPIIELSNGEAAVAVQYWPLDEDGKSFSPPYPVTSYSKTALLTGKWSGDAVEWTLQSPVPDDGKISTRGLFEGAFVEIKNKPGHLLMVLRGSNEGTPRPRTIRSVKWVSKSTDYGRTWSKPYELCDVHGDCLYSPSSISNLIYGPNGRLYWIGNIIRSRPIGNLPRYPLMIGEIDLELGAFKNFPTLIDTLGTSPFDSPNLQLSNFSIFPDEDSLIVVLHRFDHYEKFPTLALWDYPVNWYRIEFK